MLRINLLPAYVSQRRITRRLSAIFAVLVALSVVLPLAYYAKQQHDLTVLLAQADDAEKNKAITDTRKAQAAAVLTAVQPTQAKLDFVTAVHAYNRQWVALYNTLADTSPKSSLIYTDAAVTGSTMTIKAFSPSVDTVGRYLQAMYQEPDFQTVVVDKVPGYPDNVRHLYFLKGKLVFEDGGTANAGGSGSSGSYSSSSSSSSSNSSSSSQGGGQAAGSGAPSGYDPEHLAPNGPTNIPPDVGPPPPELTGGATPSGGQGSAGQATGGYSQAFLKIADRGISPFALPETREAIRRQYLRQVVMRIAPKGFGLTVTATLKQPLTPPSLPGTAPAATPGRSSGFGGSSSAASSG